MNLAEYRRQKDQFFERDPHSPLAPEQKRGFKGMDYFPENPALAFELDIQEFDVQETIQMQTSTGDLRTFTRLGRIEFEAEGQLVHLTVYQSEHGFFLPFVDALAGSETYGAGRYLDPETLPNGKLDVDFNLAYNPYCAYNDLYSCPLPPAENRLPVAIRAGEKSFK